MIRSRPGFQTVVIDDSNPQHKIAPVQPDTLPAIAKYSSAHTSRSPLDKLNPAQLNAALMQAKADAAFAKMKAEAKGTTEVLVNPTPSATPITTDPYGEDLLS